MTDNLESRVITKTAILVVDDDEHVRKSSKRIIESMPENYDIHFAENGKEAVEMLKKHNYPLVISDLTMPEMDGLKLYRWIKENIYPRPKFMLVSGSLDEEITQYLDNEGVLYLPKPFKANDYVSFIEKSFESSK